MTPQRAPRRGFGSIRKEKTGRYSARYTHQGRRYFAGTYGQRRQAEHALDRVRRAIDDGVWTPPDQEPTATTFEAFARDWIERRTVKGRPLKARTKMLYRDILERDLAPTFGSLEPARITPELVRSWHDLQMPADKPTRRAHAYSLLKTLLADALPPGTANPCQIKGAGSTERQRRLRPASMAEVDTIAAAMPEKYRAAVLLSAWAALRFGELAELRRRDLDLDTMTLYIERSVTSRAGVITIDTPKSSAGIRAVALPDHLRDVLARHLDQHAQKGHNGLLFPAADGTSHLAPSTVYKPFRRAREAAGRPDLRWHDLRHSGGMWATAAGASLREVMARMGHSSVGAAMQYQHALEERDRALVARMAQHADA